jgi:hypothetical protein
LTPQSAATIIERPTENIKLEPWKDCAVDKINEFRAVLKDPNKSKEDKRFALRFIIHCIEDLHQPCHVGDNHDRGGDGA